jgi:hypothetical protein
VCANHGGFAHINGTVCANDWPACQ